MALCCPHCGTTISATKKRTQGSVYTYTGIIMRGTADEQTGRVSVSDSYLSASFPVESLNYYVAECVECRKEFVVQRYPERVCWPFPDPAVPADIPEPVRRAFADAKIAHAVGAEVAAVMAARTALIRMQREQEVENLKDLVERGKLSTFLYRQADEVRLWANFVGHDDVSSDSPAPEDVDQLLEYAGIVLNALYVEPARLAALGEKRRAG